MNNDFAERPFYPGVVIGIRSFNVTSSRASLTGPVFPVPFVPGENLAACHKDRRMMWSRGGVIGGVMVPPRASRTTSSQAQAQALIANAQAMAPGGQVDPGMGRMTAHLSQVMYGVNVDPNTLRIQDPPPPPPPPPPSPPPEPKPESDHRAGSMECTCGYYAYLRPEYNRYRAFGTIGRIEGIIEGYGLVTVGEKGFRAEKARLLALIGVVGDEVLVIPSQRQWDGWALAVLQIDGVIYSEETNFIPRSLAERFAVPVFPTQDLALAEFPLTEPEDDDKDEEATHG